MNHQTLFQNEDVFDTDFTPDSIHALEEWRAESAGAGKRTGGIIAGISALIAAVSALVVQWLGMD